MSPQDAPAAQVATPPASVSLDTIGLFYAERANAPLWLKDDSSRAASQRLAEILRGARADGLAEGRALASRVEAAIRGGQLADDKVISEAWARYVQALRRPVAGMSYGDAQLALQIPSKVEVLNAAANAVSLSAHIEAVSSVNPLYSTLREQALKEGAEGDPRVRASLDRLRLVPAEGRAILVDSASARLWMLEDGRAVDEMRVIVGKISTPTPLVASTIHYVTLNPYWNIPADVARNSVAPLVLNRGTSYLKAARYMTADGYGANAQDIDPETVNWQAVAAGDTPVHIRQMPGEANMMGAVKFGFVNDFDIFLHDTPKKQLFARDKRTLSMGCVRLEHADRLARWLLGREPTPDGDAPEQHVKLEQGVPVYVSYLTAAVVDGRLAFPEDVYGLDALSPNAPREMAAADLSNPH